MTQIDWRYAKSNPLYTATNKRIKSHDLISIGIACIGTSIYIQMPRARSKSTEDRELDCSNWIDVISFSETRHVVVESIRRRGRRKLRITSVIAPRVIPGTLRGAIPQTNGDAPIEWARSVSYVCDTSSSICALLARRFRTAALREKCSAARIAGRPRAFLN